MNGGDERRGRGSGTLVKQDVIERNMEDSI